MKKLIAIILSLTFVLALVGCSLKNDVPTFDDIQDYTEEDFEIYLQKANRKDIIEAWGEPNGTIAEENADMWVLDEERVLVITFTENGKFKDAGINIQ